MTDGDVKLHISLLMLFSITSGFPVQKIKKIGKVNIQNGLKRDPELEYNLT